MTTPNLAQRLAGMHILDLMQHKRARPPARPRTVSARLRRRHGPQPERRPRPAELLTVLPRRQTAIQVIARRPPRRSGFFLPKFVVLGEGIPGSARTTRKRDTGGHTGAMTDSQGTGSSDSKRRRNGRALR